MTKNDSTCDECGGPATPETGAGHNGDGKYLCADCITCAKVDESWRPRSSYERAD